MWKNILIKGIAIVIIFLIIGSSLTSLGVKIDDSTYNNNAKIDKIEDIEKKQYHTRLYPTLEYDEIYYPPWDYWDKSHTGSNFSGWDNGYEGGNLTEVRIFVDTACWGIGQTNAIQTAWHNFSWTCPQDDYYRNIFDYNSHGVGVLTSGAFLDVGSLMFVSVFYKILDPDYGWSGPFVFNYFRNMRAASSLFSWLPIPGQNIDFHYPYFFSEPVTTKPLFMEGGKTYTIVGGFQIKSICVAGGGFSCVVTPSECIGKLKYIDIYSDVSYTPLLHIAPNPPTYDFGCQYRLPNLNCTFNIWNGGIDELIWSVSSDEEWVDISPSFGTSTGEIDSVVLTINTGQLSVGNHIADITVHSNYGTKTGIIEIEILNIGPVANANGPYYAVEPGDNINFDASESFDPDGDIVGYRWDFDNDGSWTDWSSSPTKKHSYDSKGAYTLKLQVKDSDGEISTDATTAFVGINWNIDVPHMSEHPIWIGLKNSVALDSNDYPHIAYSAFNRSGGNPKDLMYAYWDGSSWNYEEIDYIGEVTYGGRSLSLNFDSSWNPQIIYVDDWSGDVVYLTKDGSNWEDDLIEYDDSKYCDSTINNNDKPCAIYTHGFWQDELKYAEMVGSSWDYHTIDIVSNPDSYVFDSLSIAIDGNNNIHICYCKSDGDGGSLMYAYRSGSGTWSNPVVIDSSTSYKYGDGCSIILDNNNLPHISYCRQKPGSDSPLMYTYKKSNGQWDEPFEIDEKVNSGTTSIAIENDGDIHIAYHDILNDNINGLGHAIKQGSSWSHEIIDSQGNLGHEPCLALNSDDEPSISYFECNLNTDYKFISVRYATLDEDIEINTNPKANTGNNGRVRYQVLKNETIVFNAAESFDFDGEIGEYRWDFDNDGTWDTNWTNSTIYGHVFNSTGNYISKVQVKDNNDAFDEDVVFVEVTEIIDNQDPIIQDDTSDEAVEGYDFSFLANVTDDHEVVQVCVGYWYDSDPHFNVSIGKKEGDIWEHTITTRSGYQNLHYYISARDNYNNWAETGVKDVDIIQDDPPYIPSDPNPENGAKDVPIDSVLHWTGGDPNSGDTVTYNICLGESLPPPIVAEGISNTNYDPELENPTPTIYYWQVVAEDNHGVKTYGPIWNFTTERLTYPPSNPSIEGPRRISPGVECKFYFISVDPDRDDVYYYVKWGDGNETGWIGPYEWLDEMVQKHSWNEKGRFSIEAKAKDVFGAESGWSNFEVSVPKNKYPIFNFYILNWLFERYQNIFPLLRYIVGQ
jgi:hypothetical protein